MPAPEDFIVVPFNEGAEVEGFECGNPELNDFLTTKEVVQYREEWYGYTYLVRRAHDWALVGYYTVAQDGLEIPDDWVKKSMAAHRDVRKLPALLLGRFAVQSALQGGGIGGIILKHIITEEYERERPARVVRLTSYPDFTSWYLRRGFDFISEKERKKAEDPQSKPRLYLDLKALPGSPGVRIPKVAL